LDVDARIGDDPRSEGEVRFVAVAQVGRCTISDGFMSGSARANSSSPLTA